MKISNNTAWFCGILLLALYGCVSKPITQFTEQDFMIIKPFKERDTIIYISAKGQTDTIIFFPYKVDTIKYRNFEQGFYDQYIMSVGYNLLSGSYHRFIQTDKNSSEEILYSCSVSDISIRELKFLGLVFDDGMLNNLRIDAKKGIVFDEKQAQYKGMNINEAIQSFKFSPQTGVISYIDTSGVEWLRNR